MKSKSSSSAITTKSEPRKRKKSRSQLSNPRPPSSPRPIPRPGKKRFVASVLQILSQSTTGTQYPDQENSEKLKKQERPKFSLKKKKEEVETFTEDLSTSTSSKRKRRYRSKILNCGHTDSDFEKLVVLQSTKEITHTPSNASDKSNWFRNTSSFYKEPETVKWTDILLTTPKKIKDAPATKENKDEENKETPPKLTETKVKSIDRDFSTLIAEGPKKVDKKLYKFFYDLLETTFSVYNVNTEFNNIIPPSTFSSKVNFEIDENVVRKLAIEKTKASAGEDKETPSKFHYIKPDVKDQWDDKRLLEHFQPKAVKLATPLSPPKSIKRRQKVKPNRPIEYKKKSLPMSASLSIPNNKISVKKERKKTFINLLKKQLKMEDEDFDEPQNFYQALKVIARNKRRCQRSIHFVESKKPSEGDVHVCQFKRRKLISSGYKSSKKSKNIPESDFFKSMKSFSRNSDYSTRVKKRNNMCVIDTTADIPSVQSLEVFGFDYEPVSKKPAIKNSTSFPPSTSTSIQEYNINAPLLMKFSNSTTSSIIESSQIRAQHGLRALSELLQNKSF
ncbi:hypothetical protein HF086_014212 [Spodoptera exigua]|uniref:Uncharacterized protein n=1 Tax=Spodoptera exigua TaxID=7107 RepID=A0A922MIG5_SPOEX|nr:hypothetical protein HF086_014212 [Spodoptera exigua]